ncbi:putative serine/threonine-protein kinase [Paramyrothecium foliicola]|nr:putative serine/threonine-protein kinase [Paramyrothecium foliicola]
MRSDLRHDPLPPDPRRPPIPYVAGFETIIRPHTPPQPFGPYNSPRGEGRQPADRDEDLALTHSEFCLLHPPENTPVPKDRPGLPIRLLKQLSCERCSGAKVFRCMLNNDDRRIHVAKIYDPLYYWYPNDVSFWADLEYSVEAGAYEDIWDAGLDGKYTPKYYGSWAIQVPFSASPPVERTVCLIIMEELDGFTMESLLAKNLQSRIPPHRRLEIVGDVLEIKQKLEFAGVQHRDVAPRNIMLSNHEPFQVKFFDFNIATCLKRPGARTRKLPKDRPMNPIYLYWHRAPSDFSSWIPEPHRSRPEVWRGWAKRRWFGIKDFVDVDEAKSFYLWTPEDEALPVEYVEPFPDPPPRQESDSWIRPRPSREQSPDKAADFSRKNT